MLTGLGQKIMQAVDRLRGRGQIEDSDIQGVIRQVRLSLLESDVHLEVVRTVIEAVRTRLIGEQIQKHLKPDEKFLLILRDELLKVMQAEEKVWGVKSHQSLIFMIGLQGSGKTSTVAKLGYWLSQKERRKVGSVSLDFDRPAAEEQLRKNCEVAGINVYSGTEKSPKPKLVSALRWAFEENFLSTLIVDTAGRMHVEDELLDELKELISVRTPDEIFLVADGQLGQQATSIAQKFKYKIPITGFILTKFDSDARGGAALSIRAVTQIPIRFLTVGEKVHQMEAFAPERIVNRLLDWGDLEGLMDKAQLALSEDTEKLEQDSSQLMNKLAAGNWDLEDFLTQLKWMKRLGGLGTLMSYVPGIGRLQRESKKEMNPAEMEKEISVMQSIILSMTKEERRNPRILNGSRRQRIAKGSGRKVQEVNNFIRKFEDSKKMFDQFQKQMGSFFPKKK